MLENTSGAVLAAKHELSITSCGPASCGPARAGRPAGRQSARAPALPSTGTAATALTLAGSPAVLLAAAGAGRGGLVAARLAGLQRAAGQMAWLGARFAVHANDVNRAIAHAQAAADAERGIDRDNMFLLHLVIFSPFIEFFLKSVAQFNAVDRNRVSIY